MTAPPQWVTRLITQVCEEYGVPEPDFSWRRSRIQTYSSGRTWSASAKLPAARIVVTAGTDGQDRKMVLLHELAHYLTPDHHHDAAFWRVAFELYRTHGLLRYATKREAESSVGARRAAAACRRRRP